MKKSTTKLRKKKHLLKTGKIPGRIATVLPAVGMPLHTQEIRMPLRSQEIQSISEMPDTQVMQIFCGIAKRIPIPHQEIQGTVVAVILVSKSIYLTNFILRYKSHLRQVYEIS